MIESDWLSATSPQPMLEFLRDMGRADERRCRLFAVGCYRRVWHQLMHPNSRKVVEVAEQYAEGTITMDQLWAASCAAAAGGPDGADGFDDLWFIPNAARTDAYEAGHFSATQGADLAAYGIPYISSAYHRTMDDERAAQAALLRCIFSNPFHPPPPIEASVLAWNDGTVPKIAAAIYDDRSFDLMPILADALEDAGCSNAGILEHLRSGGPHCRGCFVIDAILGRS